MLNDLWIIKKESMQKVYYTQMQILIQVKIFNLRKFLKETAGYVARKVIKQQIAGNKRKIEIKGQQIIEPSQNQPTMWQIRRNIAIIVEKIITILNNALRNKEMTENQGLRIRKLPKWSSWQWKILIQICQSIFL